MVYFGFIVMMSLRRTAMSFYSYGHVGGMFGSVLPGSISLGLCFSPVAIDVGSRADQLYFVGTCERVYFTASINYSTVTRAERSSSDT